MGATDVANSASQDNSEEEEGRGAESSRTPMLGAPLGPGRTEGGSGSSKPQGIACFASPVLRPDATIAVAAPAGLRSSALGAGPGAFTRKCSCPMTLK